MVILMQYKEYCTYTCCSTLCCNKNKFHYNTVESGFRNQSRSLWLRFLNPRFLNPGSTVLNHQTNVKEKVASKSQSLALDLPVGDFRRDVVGWQGGVLADAVWYDLWRGPFRVQTLLAAKRLAFFPIGEPEKVMIKKLAFTIYVPTYADGNIHRRLNSDDISWKMLCFDAFKI